MEPLKSPLKTSLVIAAGVVLTLIAIFFVDHPAATWSHEHFKRPDLFNRLTQYADPIPVFATLGTAGMAVAVAFFGWRPKASGRTAIAACLAILVGEGIKAQLKYFFGRPWPETWNAANPSWIGSHSDTFYFLHGGPGWESFPSGHTTQMAALAAVMWVRLPRYRWIGVGAAVLVAFTLWISNYHYVGDILAGALLGTACGSGMVAVVCQRTAD